MTNRIEYSLIFCCATDLLGNWVQSVFEYALKDREWSTVLFEYVLKDREVSIPSY